MVNLAIKGHSTRGQEVIEILEMLGGQNYSHRLSGKTKYYYYIGTFNFINYTIKEKLNDSFITFTLEEFLKKFPYRVGDKVKCARINDFIGRVINVRWDENENQIIYVVEWDDATKSTLTYFANGLQPYKEETMEKEKNDWAKWDLPEGYEFQDKEGNVINTDVIKLVKKQPHYPKTYEECWDIFNCTVESLSLETIKNFRHLIYCRNSYWKIAGEQMGLGKPWEPDFTNNDEERYSIYTLANKVERDFCGVGDVNIILVFPTEEMRDAFYENFKDLIEQCKELL